MGILTQKSFDDCQHIGAAIRFYNEGGRTFPTEMKKERNRNHSYKKLIDGSL